MVLGSNVGTLQSAGKNFSFKYLPESSVFDIYTIFSFSVVKFLAFLLPSSSLEVFHCHQKDNKEIRIIELKNKISIKIRQKHWIEKHAKHFYLTLVSQLHYFHRHIMEIDDCSTSHHTQTKSYNLWNVCKNFLQCLEIIIKSKKDSSKLKPYFFIVKHFQVTGWQKNEDGHYFLATLNCFDFSPSITKGLWP